MEVALPSSPSPVLSPLESCPLSSPVPSLKLPPLCPEVQKPWFDLKGAILSEAECRASVLVRLLNSAQFRKVRIACLKTRWRSAPVCPEASTSLSSASCCCKSSAATSRRQVRVRRVCTARARSPTSSRDASACASRASSARAASSAENARSRWIFPARMTSHWTSSCYDES